MSNKEQKKVGPFTIKELTVEEGLDLMTMLGTDNNAFTKILLLRTIERDGKPIGKGSFSEMAPFLAELIDAAMLVNGFRAAPVESVG